MREANPTLPRYGTDPAQAQRTKALSFKH